VLSRLIQLGVKCDLLAVAPQCVLSQLPVDAPPLIEIQIQTYLDGVGMKRRK
jgi:hypothetical protein